ncbi:MAG TPA: hypothetical protein VGN16_09560 [Acidobacteriaceae bacterium]|jgi:hypothetical protein
MTKDTPSNDDVGNFALRLGYIAGAFGNPKMRAYLIERGTSEAAIDEAIMALARVADEAFYRRMGQ